MPNNLTVREVLADLAQSDRRAVYFPNQGNAGDSLINMGFYHLADAVHLRYQIRSVAKGFADLGPSDTAIIGGGGGIVPQQHSSTPLVIAELDRHAVPLQHGSTPTIIAELNRRGVRVVVLPQSIRAHGEVLRHLAPGSVVFCREAASFHYCTDLGLDVPVLTDHDMAFSANLQKLAEGPPPNRIDHGRYGPLRHGLYLYHVARSTVLKSVVAARCDSEAWDEVALPRHKWNDFSAIARFGSSDVHHAWFSAKRLYDLVTMYKEVMTDRLHVGIMCGLVGTKVRIYDNIYGKCSGVYEMSMRDMPHVELVQARVP